ncbi:hypothetical protein MKK88_14255 [Methylobacterium sp. E-005]|uniref:hypothetical protein n=1 Tax=Methylobacterium sp. E-005 TaxID=2836549 RepID=UPI001FB86338|nr:hypothetical protein [Methylobacterium sp. E-005]MCJ2087139.1 hypothetical protein [Methylobacterium sp. E-005]
MGATPTPDVVSVPDVDGVPNVLFAPGFADGIALATADDPAALSFFSGVIAPQWGLYLGGAPVVSADTIIAFDGKQEFVIADYLLERGAFESYNKVQIPFDVRLVFVAGGSEANRAALLASVTAIAGDCNVYDAVMPEKVFQNVNIIHYDFRRTAQNGVGLLSVALWCQEVRQASATYPSASGGVGDTAAPSGASPVDGGTVQATDATAAQVAMVQSQDFSGGYNVSGFNVNATATADVGELTAFDPATGQPIPEATVPGSASAPVTSSTISGLPPAGPDSFTNLNVGSVPGVS